MTLPLQLGRQLREGLREVLRKVLRGGHWAGATSSSCLHVPLLRRWRDACVPEFQCVAAPLHPLLPTPLSAALLRYSTLHEVLRTRIYIQTQQAYTVHTHTHLWLLAHTRHINRQPIAKCSNSSSSSYPPPYSSSVLTDFSHENKHIAGCMQVAKMSALCLRPGHTWQRAGSRQGGKGSHEEKGRSGRHRQRVQGWRLAQVLSSGLNVSGCCSMLLLLLS